MELLFFLFGLAIGSFVSCLVYRINKENSLKGFLKGRSYCQKCKKQLLWRDNVPLLSFLLLRGKCRWCQSPIGVHYPLVELLTGVLFVWIYLWVKSWSGNTLSFYISISLYLYISASFVAIFLSDFQYRTIPDQITYPAIFVSLIYLIANGQWLDAISGLGAASFFFLLVLLTRFRGMGLGDVKLAGLMGLFLGFPKIIVALYLAFLTGATAGVILILLGKKKFKSQISFGPFLVLATFIAWFWGEKIVRILRY